MSVAGRFNVSGATPSGNLELALEILENGAAYNGTIEARGACYPLSNIKVEGNSFTANGAVKSPYGEIDILVKCAVDGRLLTGELVSEYMTVKIDGIKI